MALRVKIAARAARQVHEAAEWWATHRPAAPDAVAIDFRETITLLSEQPGIGSKYSGARTPGVRRLFLGRVGYFVYYRADDRELRVLAFWHTSREHAPAL